MMQLYADTASPGPTDGLSAVIAAMLQAPSATSRAAAPTEARRAKPADSNVMPAPQYRRVQVRGQCLAAR